MQIFKLTATAAAVLVLCSYSLSSWGADSATAISSKKRANSVALQPQVSSDQPNKQLTGQSIPPSKAPTGTHPAISEGLQTLPPVPAAPIKQPPASVRTLPEIQQGAPSQGIRTRPSAVPPKGAPTNSARNSGSQAPGNPRIAAPGAFSRRFPSVRHPPPQTQVVIRITMPPADQTCVPERRIYRQLLRHSKMAALTTLQGGADLLNLPEPMMVRVHTP